MCSMVFILCLQLCMINKISIYLIDIGITDLNPVERNQSPGNVQQLHIATSNQNTSSPTFNPSVTPTKYPTMNPILSPKSPTSHPTLQPSLQPTLYPTATPTNNSSTLLSNAPTEYIFSTTETESPNVTNSSFVFEPTTSGNDTIRRQRRASISKRRASLQGGDNSPSFTEYTTTDDNHWPMIAGSVFGGIILILIPFCCVYFKVFNIHFHYSTKHL